MSSIRVQTSCCDPSGGTDIGFEIFLNTTIYADPVNIDSIELNNDTTGESYTSLGADPTLTINDRGVFGSYRGIQVILNDLTTVPEGRYCFAMIMDYTNDLGVPISNQLFNFCKVSLCESEAILSKELPDTLLSQECPPEDCQDLKDKFWEAYTLYRAMKIADSCDLDVAWDNSFSKLKGLLAILKKELCLNC